MRAALKTTLATVALAAAVATVPLAAPAGATTAPTCSKWAQAGTTKYFVRECAGVVKYSSGKFVKETVYIKNTGSHHLTVNGFIAVSWGQAGDGTEIKNVKVNPGHSTSIGHAFKMSSSGPYTATSSITAGGHTATAQSTFTK